MIFVQTIMALPFLVAITPQLDGCLPIQDDRIYARDVVSAVPAFTNVAADFVLGYPATTQNPVSERSQQKCE